MVRKTANFTPLQAEIAEIYEELASEIRNNEGIILHLCLEPVFSNFRDTAEEIATKYPDCKVIIRVEEHLTCALYWVV